MPLPALLVSSIISGLSALAGGFANRKQKQTQANASSTTINATRAPVYDEKTGNVRDFLLNQLMSGVESTPDFQQQYLNNGFANINRGADATSNNIRQAMIGRGLGRTSAGFAPEVASENARFGQLAQFENNAPLVQDEMRRKRLLELSQFFATLPTGTSQTGTTNTTGSGTGTTPGNMLGGAMQGGSQMAAFLYGNGGFGKGRN